MRVCEGLTCLQLCGYNASQNTARGTYQCYSMQLVQRVKKDYNYNYTLSLKFIPTGTRICHCNGTWGSVHCIDIFTIVQELVRLIPSVCICMHIIIMAIIHTNNTLYIHCTIQVHAHMLHMYKFPRPSSQYVAQLHAKHL